MLYLHLYMRVTTWSGWKAWFTLQFVVLTWVAELFCYECMVFVVYGKSHAISFAVNVLHFDNNIQADVFKTWRKALSYDYTFISVKMCESFWIWPVARVTNSVRYFALLISSVTRWHFIATVKQYTVRMILQFL